MTEPMDEREARRRYVRSRQTRVFTIVGAVMAAALILSMLFYFHVLGSSHRQSVAAEPNFGVVAPCAPKDRDGNTATYINNSTVTVRVLNGTKFNGLAKAASDALTNRNFTVATVDTYSRQNVERTTIYFGKNAIAEAYTLGSNFTDAKMVMDDRTDKLVDVVLGATFNDLREQKTVPAVGAKITSFTTCKPAAQLTKLPKAIAHDPVS